ncbi:MAG: peptidylprolyl isomerase [Elusimicrobia bacterium]|nr:peptidylprolyl isomerase [Elusimicrobiota bacterium]
MRIITVFILSLIMVSGCTRKEDIVAYVGGKKITIKDFERRVKELPSYYLGFISTQGGKRQYISGMIKEEVLLQKARDFGLEKRPEIARRLEDARREVLLASVIGYIHEEKIKVSDQEIRDYYEENEDQYANPEQIKISHILLSDEKSAKEVYAQLKKGASFEDMAREYSIDTVTAINGGDLGYFGRGDMSQPEFENEVFKLERVGSISEIIKSPFGYHIAKLTGRRRGNTKTFEEAKEEIKQKLEKEKFNTLLEDFRREYNVRVDYDVLDEVKLMEEEVNADEDTKE